MKWFRRDLIRGLAVLGIFCVLIISTDFLYPYSINPAGYTVVGIKTLNENPLPLEGSAISTSATIVSVADHGSYYSAEVSEGATLVFPSTLNSPVEGQRILLRGTSWLYSNGSIVVHEFYALDSSVSLIRSIPGILLFIVMFFMIFKIDIRRLAFVSREEETESA
ncbi:MAG: hypothetical protein ACTSRU_16365 [Candidatus Hodarchaeales archaeon]